MHLYIMVLLILGSGFHSGLALYDFYVFETGPEGPELEDQQVEKKAKQRELDLRS
jgi:hypothetical protein